MRIFKNTKEINNNIDKSSYVIGFVFRNQLRKIQRTCPSKIQSSVWAVLYWWKINPVFYKLIFTVLTDLQIVTWFSPSEIRKQSQTVSLQRTSMQPHLGWWHLNEITITRDATIQWLSSCITIICCQWKSLLKFQEQHSLTGISFSTKLISDAIWRRVTLIISTTSKRYWWTSI